jgi:hypothetical protein
MTQTLSSDVLVIGGGLFGAAAALYLSGKGRKVILLEKESRLFTKASIVNQARLHNGCHYPRSMTTAMQAHEHRERFIEDHKFAVNSTFKQYYAIDKYNSFIDAAQFERFAQTVGIPLTPTDDVDGISTARLERIYETDEHSFDPYLIATHYKQRLDESNVTVIKNATITEATVHGKDWRVAVAAGDEHYNINTSAVVNATYAAVNSVNGLFDMPQIELQHELSEIGLFYSPPLQHIGFTVMDGPFCSVMPYGLSGLSSLSSVIYTHIEVSRAANANFACQQKSTTCKPERLDACLTCPLTPPSNLDKMIAQLKQYVTADIPLQRQFSIFTVKTKLKASYIDDSRPTLIQKMHPDKDFYCLFGGKINSIYEAESALAHV